MTRQNYVAYALAVIILIMFAWILTRQIQEYRMQSDPMITLLRDMLKPVHPIFETLKIYKGDKSFSLNKEKVFLCLYDQNGELYPLQQLIYVLSHEAAHCLNTESVGHDILFQRKFDELLERATKLGIFNSNIPIMQDYCNY